MKEPVATLASAWKHTALTKCLAIEYPIIQGPLGGFQSQPLTAAVSNFGGLGSFGAHGLDAAQITDVIAELRTLTSKPFAINLWVSMEDVAASSSDAGAFQRALAPIAPHIRRLGGTLPVYQPYRSRRFEDQVRAVIDARVPAFSFICGIPPKDIIDECRSQHIVVLGTATTPEESVALEQAGVDVVVASGFEAGGHRGSFLRPAEESSTGTFSLVPQVVDAVAVPVVAAGGIADARGVTAAFALGADGVQIGTAFLPAPESGAHAQHRRRLLQGRAETALTMSFTGRLARGIRNSLMDELDRAGSRLPYPLQRGLVRHLTVLADEAGDSERMILWAGQSANLARFTDATAFLQDLVSALTFTPAPTQA